VTEKAFTFSDINPAYKINRLVFEMGEIRISCGESDSLFVEFEHFRRTERASTWSRKSRVSNRREKLVSRQPFAGSGECRLYVRQWFHRTPSEWRIIESGMVNSLGEETILRA
jgi:hypothetical protein